MERLYYVFEERDYKKVVKELKAMGLVLAENETGGYDIAGDLGKGSISTKLEESAVKIYLELITNEPQTFIARLGKPAQQDRIMPTNLDVANYILEHEFNTREELYKMLYSDLGMSQVAVRNSINAILRLGEKETAPKEIRAAREKLLKIN
ncbi:MAG: hypothetical protein QXL15_04740 [Candidatus Korarchaeota archaeon]